MKTRSNIKRVSADDFDFIYSLYFHPDINPYLLYEMMNKAEFQPIYDDLLSKSCVYIFETDGQNVGMFKLIPLTYRSSHGAYLGGVAIHPSFSGQGFGQQMMTAITDFGKKQGFLRIELSTSMQNEKAIHLYEKTGFKREGILKRYTHLKSENLFLDELLMAFLVN